jgi:antitoxin MazE
MRTKVQRWGNSLAVRIPKTFAEEVGLTDDSPVEMRLVKGGLLVEPSPSWAAPTLDELLDDVTETNLHDEIDTGAAQGSEAW